MRRRLWIVTMIAVMAAFSALLPVVASADTIKFSVDTDLAVVGFSSTSSDYKVDKHNKIKEVRIETLGEQIAGSFINCVSDEDLLDPLDPLSFCVMVEESTFTSIHDSNVKLTKVSVVPGADLGLGIFPTVLLGDLKGELEGIVTVAKKLDGDSFMEGSIKLKIRRQKGLPKIVPTAIYGCFAPGPVSISVCAPGGTGGLLLPVVLNIQDKGKLKLDVFEGDFSGIEKVDGKLVVDINGLVGTGTISKGKVK